MNNLESGKQNKLENSTEKSELKELIIDQDKLEKRLQEDESISPQVEKEITGLGGAKEILMSRLKGVQEKIKKAVEVVKAKSRTLMLFTGLGLTITAVDKLTTNHEHHNKLTIENSDPIMAKERAGAYVPNKSEWCAEHVEPFGYSAVFSVESKFGTFQGDKTREQERAVDRFDAWYLYLGLEQKEGTFEVSPYKPAQAENPNTVYYRMPKKEGFLLRNGLMTLTAKGKEKETLIDFGKAARAHSYVSDEAVKKVKDSDALDSNSELKERYHLQPIIDSIAKFNPDNYYGVMGRYLVSKGVDERGNYLSYYDKWDLHPGLGFGDKEASEVAGVGKPFEIYGRIYYDPKTGEPIKIDK